MEDLSNMSDETRRSYKRAWEDFAHWCAQNDSVALPASEVTLINYATHLALEQELSPSSVKVAVFALKRVHTRQRPALSWSGGEGLRAVLKALERRRYGTGWTPKRTRPLRPDEAELLLAAADADGVRSSALIALMLYTGARISELLSADIGDIVQESGVPVLQVMGKGRKRRSVPIIPAVYARLERYLASRPHAELLLVLPGQESRRSQPLFVTKTGRRMMATQVRNTLLRCARKAGLDAEVVAVLRPHSTRATYATSNLAAGVPLRDVQYALGHEDPRTTEGYDRSSLQLDRHPSARLATVIKPPPVPE